MTLQDALVAYRICARAEGKSPKTVAWVTSSVGYFATFLGPEHQDIAGITVNDIRRFMIALQETRKYSSHPFNKPQQDKLSRISIDTYIRGIRGFFSFLKREGLIEVNPMEKVKSPRISQKVVSTLSEKQLERLLSLPDRHMNNGFRDYVIMLLLIDSGARLSEVAHLTTDNVDLENGYIKVMGKGSRERFIPLGFKANKMLLKYKLKYRPESASAERFFLTGDGRPLNGGRIQKIIADYGKKAGLKRCHPHLFRHTSSVLYPAEWRRPVHIAEETWTCQFGHDKALF